MKRFLGLLLGAVLGTLIAYFLRKYLSRQEVVVAPARVAPPPPAPESLSQPVEKSTAKFTVRRTGPRPAAPLIDVDILPSSANGSSTEVQETFEVAATSPESALSQMEQTESKLGAEYEAEADSQPLIGDDFLIIDDIGPVFNRKLKEAGITSYANLAALSVEEIADIAGTSATRVERNLWREQAIRLSEGKPLKED
jgi:predicted flap endonuclease-1-like 5' DNA nuclease